MFQHYQMVVLNHYWHFNITELDYNKMLAIITYKNLFPRDFSDLQLNQGFVFTLFDQKDAFISDEITKLNQKIEGKKREIKTENKFSNKLPEMENELSILEQELILTENKQLHEIITRDNINSIFSITRTNEFRLETTFKDIKCSEYFDLLKYLIRNGYIDETYADYMTYFYENSLSRIDKIFLRSITDKKAKEYIYKLKNPQLVVSHLRLVDFDQEEILNFDLLTYLLHSLSPIEYLERYINQLKETKNFKFIGAYFDVTSELPAYVKHLNSHWPEMFLTALKTSALSDKQMRIYSISSIYNLNTT